jgi:hypothetical protein
MNKNAQLFIKQAQQIILNDSGIKNPNLFIHM